MNDFGETPTMVEGAGATGSALVVAVFEPRAWGRDSAPPSDLDTRAVSGFCSLY
jgi:hypothetical protein